jgi:antirestriction protein
MTTHDNIQSGASRPAPRVYVACLAAYNNGCLHGQWIDANQPVDDIWSEVQEMLAASPENATCQWCGAVMVSTDGPVRWDKPCTHGEHFPASAEEWAIHDYEGFGALQLSEWESFERVSAIAAGVENHGDAFTAWLSYDSSRDPSDLDAFDDAYRGEWDSLRDYAEDFADSTGLYDMASEAGSPYVTVDVDALERDLDIDLYTVESDHYTIYVFDRNS